MKKTILLLLSLTLYFACSNKEKVSVSNDLKKRVLLIESYHPAITSYVSDSIVETYQNKIITKSEYYYKENKDALFVSSFQTYEYNENSYLIKTNNYSDPNLSTKYATTSYTYKNGKIQSRVFNKFAPSSFSSNLAHYTTQFEYDANTITKYNVNHLNGDSVEKLEKYITYGNLDSINAKGKWMYILDNLNNITNINCLGSDCDEYYNTKYIYKDLKTPLINNVFGNDVNKFLLGALFKYHYLETSKKQMTQVLSIFPTIERNGNTKNFNYVFDENNRLVEIYTSGTFVTKDIIKYYYE